MRKSFIQNSVAIANAQKQDGLAMNSFAELVQNKSQSAQIIITTFKGRILESGNQNVRAEQRNFYAEGNNGRVAHDMKGRSFSKDALTAAYGKTIRQVGINYLTEKQRRAGERIWNIPFLGGDRDGGTFKHLHSIIGISFDVDLAKFKERISNVFLHQMKKAYKEVPLSRLAAEVYFDESYKHSDGNFCIIAPDSKDLTLEVERAK